MKTWIIRELIFPAVGNPFYEYVGRVDSRTEQSALNKAAKVFIWDRGGIPNRKRHSKNFTARKFN